MPLYDVFVIFKPLVERKVMTDILVRIGHKVYQQKGVVTNVKYFGRQFLAYDIKKRDGRHYEGHLMQMTVMAATAFNEQLQYLNNDERLLRWLLIKNRGTKWMDALQGKLPSVDVQDEDLFRAR
ncbi:hypothetical protein SELMODRAFT_99143 [Selaginella moellendorffii]|uniref:Ribosomal protein S6 n=1 Tax=Selaginella moellendorffii TaxID=88036 RepID=D8RQR6_SELML|nr:uncharacterized protein LOC9637803 [Selaginella moellendorffii]EFJ25502.1 hypothetical protein SELMODRAFT_99143 [Selaginella moellendorffii]|eukprot:XP_002973128.1 uncharacterized protein LOC9637803 [Selaginella moellendorffii]